MREIVAAQDREEPNRVTLGERHNSRRMNQYQPGDEIAGEYTVKRVFGGKDKSGMGVVYLVEHREYRTPFVLKTFQRTTSEDAKRFVSEATAWIKAGSHPHIVEAYWVKELAGQLFVAAEYVEPDVNDRNSLEAVSYTHLTLPTKRIV